MPHKDKRKTAFLLHRHRAKRIGVEMLFTFDEWVAWWEAKLGPDWFKKRGQRLGQYVMARYGDKGPYHPDNVKCILQTENTREAKRQIGELNGRCKITQEQALFIKNAKTNSRIALSKQFGISRSAVRDIRNGRNWKHL